MLSNECRFAQIRIGQARLGDKAAAGAWILFSYDLQRFFRFLQGGRRKEWWDKKAKKTRLIDLYADGFNPAYTKEELALFNQGKALDPLVLHFRKTLSSNPLTMAGMSAHQIGKIKISRLVVFKSS